MPGTTGGVGRGCNIDVDVEGNCCTIAYHVVGQLRVECCGEVFGMVGTIDHAGILTKFEEAVVGGISAPFYCLAIDIEPIARSFAGIDRIALSDLAIVHLELAILESLEDLIGGHLEGIAECLAYIDLFRALPICIAGPGQVDVLGEVFRLTFGRQC